MPLTKDTVAVPVAKGIQTQTAARLVTPEYLLEAKNAVLTGGGSKKRFGHEGILVREGDYPPNVTEIEQGQTVTRNFGTKTIPANYLAGWGVINNAYSTAADTLPRSEYPEAGAVLGGATRDRELLSWDGTNLYSYVSNTATFSRYNAATPTLRAKAIGKVPESQQYPDIADNGVKRVITWYNPRLSSIQYSVLDSTNESVVLRAVTLPNPVNTGAKVIALGGWFHIILLDTNLGALQMISFYGETPEDTSVRSLGDALYWDAWKHDENTVLVVRSDGTSATAAWFRNTGQGHPSYTNNIVLPLAHACTKVAVAQHPTIGEFAVVYQSGTSVYSSVLTTAGVSVNGDALLDSATSGETWSKPTVAPRYLPMRVTIADVEGDHALFDAYVTWSNTTRFRTFSRSFTALAAIANISTHYHAAVASHAFRAGHRTYCWLGFNSTLQSKWVLADFELKPVGGLDFETANTQEITSTDMFLATPNFVVDTQKDLLVFNMGLGYRVRVETDDDQVGLFTEPSIRYVELDFLPWLRSAQAGRCTYFVGAQLWSYDGAEVVEQGFHIAPEFTLTASNGGSLTADGTYSYRVDLCYTNAQGEEVRSHSLLQQVTLTGSQGTITIDIKPSPTRRDGAYYLIFRNAMVSGAPTTSWNLLNSRDPDNADFILNEADIATKSFVDDGTTFTDTEIQTREAYPGNNSAYIYPFAGPACEIVCAGADRLWVAGGELPAGQVAPSRLFDPGEAPAFNANINRQVDRGEDAITALGFVGGVVIMFRLRSAYILDGDGPDNFANGYWPPARLALTDVGAVSQESLALITQGLVFQGEPGIRMIGPGGASTPLGYSVDPTARAAGLTIRNAVVVPQTREIRWYGEEFVLVYNYLSDCWSTWTLTSSGAVFNKTTGLGVVFKGGKLLVETDGLYTDDGATYEHRIRFPWLHAGNLGDFQRIRRFAGFGEWTSNHRVRVEIYYDERAHWEEYWEWDFPDTSNNGDAWGDNSWGDGVWGDTADATLNDSVWRWRRRPRRQKCSVFSVAVSDLGTTNEGFTLTTLGLEIGRKTGLDRIPAVSGGTDSFRK